MRIRGAPLLGASAAFALALTAYNSHAKTVERLIQELKESGEKIRRTRPTAVNLFWALDRILSKVETFRDNVNDLATLMMEEANRIADEDVQANHMIGKHGAELIKDGDNVLTHCNAGALATVDYGTALGVVRAAMEQGKRVNVLAREHNIPFYVAAPKSTFDMSKVSAEVVIEERDPEEITRINSKRIAPQGVNVFNPAFDITPIDYVTAIICEDGILRKRDFNELKT